MGSGDYVFVEEHGKESMQEVRRLPLALIPPTH